VLNQACTSGFRLLTALLGLCLCLGRPCGAQAARDGWILVEEAKALIADRENPDMGQALKLLREAIEGQGTFFPEAEMALADIYFREGAYEPAADRLEQVLKEENLPLLRVGEEEFAARYRLAEIREIQKRYADMEKALERILLKEPEYSSADQQRFRDGLLSAFRTRGLDHALQLYRLEKSGFALAAHDKLGRFAYWNARYEPASLLHLLFAVDIMVSEAVQELRRVMPDFEYRSLGDFLRTAQRRDNVRQYLSDGGFFRVAYYLAAASHAALRLDRAKEIWSVLAGDPWDPALAGPYAERSRRQLREPRVEKGIDLQGRQVQFPPD